MDPELAALQHAIQILHQLMTVMQDPQAVAVVSTCLRNLTQLQQQMMQQQGGAQGQPQQAQGGPGGAGMNPIAAALAQRLAGAQQGAQPAGAGAGGY